jgi:hypothetical protein
MKKYNCTYKNAHQFGAVLENISASSPRDAYQKYIEKAGVHEAVVYVETGLLSTETFDDHLDGIEKLEEEEKAQTGKHPQESADKENSNLEQPYIDSKTHDSDLKYQESGWETFLFICGVFNLVLFVGGGVFLLDLSSHSEKFGMVMNLTIIGLIAAINSFFFAFLVNTFTRIQHNTHLTTLELIKLNKKNDSDN